MSAAKAYIVEVRHYYEPSTLKEIDRKLRYLGVVFGELRAKGAVETTSPYTMTERDIGAFLGWMKEQDLDPATQHKYIGILQGFLDWAGNGTIRQMRAKKRFRIVVPPKPLHPISEDRLKLVCLAAGAAVGWPGEVLQFIVNGVPYMGLRPGEFRLLRLQDIDTVSWRVRVSSPKGEGRWTSGGDDGEWAPILPPGRQPTLDFLEARDAYLRSQGLDPNRVEPLIPYISPRTKLVHCWNESVLSRLKCRQIEDVVGFKFQFRDLRPTFGQMNKDRGVSIEAVSKMMRHRSTRTTELYYCRLRDDKAFEEAERAWGA